MKMSLKKAIFLLILGLSILNLEASWLSFANPIIEQTLSHTFIESTKEYYNAVSNFVTMHPIYAGLGAGLLGVASLWYINSGKKPSPEYYDVLGHKVDNVNNYYIVDNAVNKHLEGSQKYVVINCSAEKKEEKGIIIITKTTILEPNSEPQKMEKNFYVDKRKFLVSTEDSSNETKKGKKIVIQTIKLEEKN